jgi:hypothetical protein
LNYKKAYNSLIQKAQSRSKPEGYVESHHIIPSCLGGSDDKDNLVFLTAREHCLAHLLLAKIHGGKLWVPIERMTIKFSINSRAYQIAREKAAESMTGVKNPMWGKKRPDLSEHNRTRINPLKGKSGALSKTSKPLCVEFLNGDVVFTEVGAEEFARQIGMPTGSMSYCISTGSSMPKYSIQKAWRP